MILRLATLSLLLASSMLASCGSDDGGTTTTPAAATVAVTNNKFTPANVTVKVGDTVEWQFQQGAHDVTSGTNAGDPPTCTPDAKFASGDAQSSGTFRFTFKTAGTYPYFCTPHCLQKQFGTVTVTP